MSSKDVFAHGCANEAHIGKTHSRCDIGPLQAGLCLPRVTQGLLHAWAVLMNLMPLYNAPVEERTGG